MWAVERIMIMTRSSGQGPGGSNHFKGSKLTGGIGQESQVDRALYLGRPLAAAAVDDDDGSRSGLGGGCGQACGRQRDSAGRSSLFKCNNSGATLSPASQPASQCVLADDNESRRVCQLICILPGSLTG